MTENFTLILSSDCFATALVIEVMLSSRLLLHYFYSTVQREFKQIAETT